MELAIKEIENKIKEYKDILNNNKPLDYGEGVVEGLEEAIEILKKLTVIQSSLHVKDKNTISFGD